MRRKIDLFDGRRVRVERQTALEELRSDLVRAAYVEGNFIFSGGLQSDYYLDKYLFETRPAILRRLGRLLSEHVPPGTERLAAPALGSVALGTALSLELGLPLVIVRVDEPSGSSRSVEGEIYPGENVTLIEDVIVTGNRALSAVSRVGATGATCRHVACVLDRQEGARARLEEEDLGFSHLFTPEELGIE